MSGLRRKLNQFYYIFIDINSVHLIAYVIDVCLE